MSRLRIGARTLALLALAAMLAWLVQELPPLPPTAHADENVRSTDAGSASEPVYRDGPETRFGIGKYYFGREIARVMSHLGADWLERPERQLEERPDLVIANLKLGPGDVVADIGAGSGYMSFRMAKLVPRGRVLAVDIQPEMLARLDESRRAQGVENLTPVLGSVRDPKLPAEGVDLALMVDAYHEFSHPYEMMRALVGALRPGGRVVLVEYRGEDPSVPILPTHKMTQAQVKREMRAVGLQWVETLDLLPQQHMMVFRKPESD